MKDLALFLAKNLVNDAETVQASASEDGEISRVHLRVADEDKGKIIGKQGRVIKAMRHVVGIAGAKAQRKVLLDLE